jgi:Protein of unknown function (DUF2807).
MRSTDLLFVFALVVSAPAFAAETVPVPAFRAVELHGGGIVTLSPASVPRVTIVEGSSQFTHFRVDGEGKLLIDVCQVRCPENYHLRLRIEAPQLLGVGIHGGGLITAANGFAPQKALGVAINGGGKIDVRSMDANAVGAAVNGGGEIFVRARGTLAATINGGGEIRYWGNPALVTSVRGGGLVHRAN